MKKYKVSCSIIAIAVMLILASLFLFGRDDKKGSNGILWNGKQSIEKEYEQSSISIPGFDEISFKSNSTNQKVNIYNPDTNNCTMNFSIIMPDNTILWAEENIQPEYGLYDIQINKELKKGTYEGCVFTVRCFRDGIELNGCNITFTLYVY